MGYIRSYRYRIYPTPAQEELIAFQLKCTRFAYNYFLNIRVKAWQERKETIGYIDTSRMMTQLKHEPSHQWLKAADAKALQESLRDLEHGFQNFFAKRGGHPRPKTSRSRSQSYRTRNQNDAIHWIGNTHIRLPKLKGVRVIRSREIPGRILNATIYKKASGRYYLTLCVEIEVPPAASQAENLGIGYDPEGFIYDSQGRRFEFPATLVKLAGRYARAQQRFNRKVAGSSNKEKQRLVFARLNERLTNTRRDFLHKLSTQLLRENSLLVVEELPWQVIKALKLQSHTAIDNIAGGWLEFVHMLEYKAPAYGSRLQKVTRSMPLLLDRELIQQEAVVADKNLRSCLAAYLLQQGKALAEAGKKNKK